MGGSPDIAGRISNEADPGLRPTKFARQFDAAAKNVFPFFPLIAERTEVEELPQASPLQLKPADAFQVPGHHADQLAAMMQSFQQSANRGTGLHFHTLGIAFHFRAHQLERGRQASFKIGWNFAVIFQSRPQDTDIGVAVYRHRIDTPLASVDLAQGRVEGLVMYASVRIHQRAVDVEQVRVEIPPVEVGIGHRNSVYRTDKSDSPCPDVQKTQRLHKGSKLIRKEFDKTIGCRAGRGIDKSSRGAENMTRIFMLISSLLLVAALAGAQDTPGSGAKLGGRELPPRSAAESTNPQSTVIRGCLTGSPGNFTLTDQNGMQYKLMGSDNLLQSKVGHEIEITGVENQAGGPAQQSAAPAPNGVQVSDVRDVAGSCRLGHEGNSQPPTQVPPDK